MNLIVTCSAAGLTHTTRGGVFAASSLMVNALIARAASRRTASPTSIATNTRARDGELIRLTASDRGASTIEQIAAQHIDRPVRGHRLDDFTAAGEPERAHARRVES